MKRELSQKNYYPTLCAGKAIINKKTEQDFPEDIEINRKNGELFLGYKDNFEIDEFELYEVILNE